MHSDLVIEVGFVSFDVALSGLNVGDVGRVVGFLGVAVLAGEDAFGDKDAIALDGDGG